MMASKGFLSLFAVLCVAAVPSLAHHGVAPHYDQEKPVRIDGFVTRFDFINPHSFVYIEMREEDGEAQTWKCELPSRATLSRNGVEAALFSVGRHVTLDGIAARRDPTGCAFRSVTFDDGSVLTSTRFFEPLPPKSVSDADRNLVFGTWALKEFSVSYYEGVMTPAGERAREAFDPVADDPSIRCEARSPVRLWVTLNLPFEIHQDGDRILIDYQYMDARRVVHLDSQKAPEDVPSSPLGYSRGHFEGSTLVIETTAFSAEPLEPRRGVMHSERLKLTEYLSVDPETGELEITWIIDDPVYFLEPVVQTERFVRTDRVLEPYDCQPQG